MARTNKAISLLGQPLTLYTNNGVRVNGATVTAPDVMASNGVIHVIDRVLMPKDDIIDVAMKAGSFKTLLTAVQAADLTDTLRSGGPYTVFAPTDEAFGKLPPGTIDALVKDPETLREILTYHVVPGAVTAADVVKLKRAKTVQGDSIRINTASGVMVDAAKVIKTDIHAGNGVIHVIDTVIMPESLAK